jgi:DNA polymerase III sliding clamp (beta) subunit (PCNA family)
MDRAELATALAAVRFAVGADPELPMLAGILFDLDGDILRLVASDSYRIAFAEVAVGRSPGAALNVLVPTGLADDIRRLAEAAGTDEITVVLEGSRVIALADGRVAEGWSLDLDFPDYHRLLRVDSVHRISVEAAELRRAVTDGGTRSIVRSKDGVSFDVTVLVVGPDGSLRIAGETEMADEAVDGLRIGANREFLLEALAASATDQLVLELGGSIHPLAIRSAGTEGTFSILMPTLLP